MGSSGHRRRGYRRHGRVRRWHLFHLNGIAGDPYKTLTLALTGKMTVTAMAVFCVLKLAATVCSYSSGGSGGIFAPALFMGAMLGGAVGYLDVISFTIRQTPSAHLPWSAWELSLRDRSCPMTSVLIIFEMTGGYGLVLPLMIANMSAFALARHWRHTPVYEALLAQDGIYLPHGGGPCFCRTTTNLCGHCSSLNPCLSFNGAHSARLVEIESNLPKSRQPESRPQQPAFASRDRGHPKNTPIPGSSAQKVSKMRQKRAILQIFVRF